MTQTDSAKPSSEGRRGFLKLAAAGAAGAAAAATIAKPAEAAVEAKGAGYVETDHVRTYYETCKF